MLDGFWMVDRHNGRIVDVNDAMCLMLGYSREEMLRLSVADVEASLSPEQVSQRIGRLIKDGSERFQSSHRRRDGTIIDVDVSAVYLPGKGLILGFHRDITERKHAEMGIPDSVLLKAGTLNEREWEIMKRHPEYADNLLSRIEYLRPTLDIPYSHHEKWDGTGYPRGLKGEEIPLSARIFAIVDVWDALTNDRPYRLAWSRPDALEYTRQQSGRHFDPTVMEAFMEMINESSLHDKKSPGSGPIE